MVRLGLCAGGDGAMDRCAEHWRVAYCVNMVLGTWEELGLSEDRHYRVSEKPVQETNRREYFIR